MKREDQLALLERYEKGNCTAVEKKIVEDWYDAQLPEIRTLKSREDELLIRKQNSFQQILNSGKGRCRSPFMIWSVRILFVAATVTVVASLWAVLFTNSSNLPTRYSNDIDPGGNKAIITLNDGKNIPLSEQQSGVIIDAAKMTYSDGTLISNDRLGKFKIATPKGGTYQARLPDGSKVWLNSASSITYSKSTINGLGARRVNLTGEAYFEVSKDKQHPFIVTTRKQVVTVLGTHFNISSYENQVADKTTLIEGSVRVDLAADSGKIMSTKTEILKPGEQAVTSESKILVAHPDPKIASSWKDGDFVFNNEPLEDILKEVSRWYDVEIEYNDSTLKKRFFGGIISKSEKISKVLRMLELVGDDVKFDIKGKKIIVSKI